MYEIDVRRWGRSVVKVRVPREADATSREGDQMVEEAQGTQREKRHADQKLWELRVRGEWRRALADVEVLTAGIRLKTWLLHGEIKRKTFV